MILPTVRRLAGSATFCDPAGCVAQRFRTATEAERAALFRVLAALRSGEQKSTGKLHAELFPGGEMSRDAFEDVLGAMARAGLARLSDAVFEKDGKQIPYRTVRLTPAGRAADKTTPIEFIMKDTAAPPTKRKRKKKTLHFSKAENRQRGEGTYDAEGETHTSRDGITRLKRRCVAWRLLEARRRGVPAFRIFSDLTSERHCSKASRKGCRAPRRSRESA